MDGSHFDQVTAFLATVDQAGFTAAGAVLDRDGSLVSRRVSALEKRLGVRLLERTTRRIALTEAGEAYYQRMRAAVQTIAEIDAEAAEASGMVRGTLRLSLPATFGRMWIAPFIGRFLEDHPGLTVEASYEDRYVDLVAECIDVAVRIGELADSRLIAQKLAPARRLLCASPEYLAKRGEPTHPGELEAHDCIGFSRLASHPVWHLQGGDGPLAVHISGPLVTDDATSLVEAAAAGTGIAMVSDWLAGRELESGRLLPILIDYPVVAREAIYVVHPSARLVPAKTRAFIAWMVNRLSTDRGA